MSMARNAIKMLTALLLMFTAGVAGTGPAAADGSQTPKEVKAGIETLPWPLLERDDTHWRVYSVKKLLGVPTNTQRDLYNEALHRAVTKYQEDEDLSERNQVGTETWENLRHGFGEVGRGATGGKVYAVQRALQNNGYPRVRLDGIYGDDTEQAVRHFQKKVGISVDGITGRFTFRALICKGT